MKEIIFLLLAIQAFCCEIDMECKLCIEHNCEFFVTKDYKTFCTKDRDSVRKVRLVIETESSCKLAMKMIERNRNGDLASSANTDFPFNFVINITTTQVPESITPSVNISAEAVTELVELDSAASHSGSSIATVEPSYHNIHFPIENATGATPPAITLEGTKSNATKHEIKSSKNSTNSVDRTLRLSDSVEMFLRLPMSYNCNNGERNESLLVSYASSLCMIAKLSKQYGIEHFSDTDMGWFLMNPARRFFGQCTAIRRYRKVCRTNTTRKIRPLNIGLQRGHRSPLFTKVDSLWHCGGIEKENLLSRLARVICYSGELFLELRESTQLHNYDLAYGLSNVSYRHAFKCASLYFKKRRCYK